MVKAIGSFVLALSLIGLAGVALYQPDDVVICTSPVRHLAPCPACGGSGNGPFQCSQCGGTGKSGGFQCSFCNGRGWGKCSSCNGTGQK